MERAKLTNGQKAESVNIKSVRAPLNKTGRKPKAEKLVCRYCGSDDLAPSFIQRRDRRCRKCFSKRQREEGAEQEVATIRCDERPGSEKSPVSFLIWR
jgi:hypothetical protein